MKFENFFYLVLCLDLLETSKVLTSGHNPVLSSIGAFLSLIGFFSLQLVFKDFDQVNFYSYNQLSSKYFHYFQTPHSLGFNLST